MDTERFKHAIRFSRPDLLPEQGMAFRKHEDSRFQSYEFRASVAVHLARSRISFNHGVQPDIIDNQPIACGFEDVSILFFRSYLALGNWTHKAYLLLSSIA